MTREQWKERLKRDDEMRPFIEAFAAGKKIKKKVYGGQWEESDDLLFDGCPSDYRIVEPPKYREWTLEDFNPVAKCFLRLKGSSGWFMCFSAVTTGIIRWDREFTWSELLQNYEYSIDGCNTWLPCGVEVK